MPSVRNTLLAVCVLTALVGAQSTIVPGSGAFVDISPAGNALGVAITGVGDDSLHNITTTIGNGMFPAGPVRVGNNGFAIAGTTNASVSLTNATIPASGLPSGVTAGTLPGPAYSYLMPYWDDLDPVPEPSAVTIYWWEDTANSILYIQWNNDGHFVGVAGQFITFQLQVFGGVNPGCSGAASAKYAYLDTTFGGSQASLDNGSSATVGLVKGPTGVGLSNALFSFNTASLSAGLILDVIGAPGGNLVLTASSPGGPGDLQVDITNGPCGGSPYFLAVTTVGGLFPAGWFFGLDIGMTDLVNQYNSGFPFTGSLTPTPSGSAITIGPFGAGALPSGFQFWAVATRLAANGAPHFPSNAITYVIP